MSEPLTDPDTGPAEDDPWVWQGFYGPMATAVAAKLVTDADPRVGVWIPLPGQPPLPVDESAEDGMFAVQTRPGNPVPTPAGMKPARAAMVGRMVGG